MSDPTIPPEALEAGKDAAFSWLRSYMEDDVRVQNMTDEELGELVEAACLAMLRAWPHAFNEDARLLGAGAGLCLILPLPQEASDE